MNARAAAGSAGFLIIAPGMLAGLVPWLWTGWDVQDDLWIPLRVLGALLAAGGAAVLLRAFARFVFEGTGTPAPVAPTRRLVIGGAYRRVRNPMYLAVASIIFGQALLLGHAGLAAYGAIFLAVTAAFVRVYEEPALTRSFGAEYEAYRAARPGWRPRMRPWAGPRSDDRDQ